MEKINLLLINPPLPENFGYKGVMERIEPPLGLLYIAAVCRPVVSKLECIDAIAEKLNITDMISIIKNFKPNIIAITCTTDTLDRAVDLAEQIKKENIEATIILGGAHISALPVKTLTDYDCFDMGVVGEGEYVLKELIENFGGDYNQIKGLIWRNNEIITLNEKREMIQNLDELPFPARDIVKMSYYIPASTEYKRLPSMSIVTSRGCPYGCAFCSKSIFGRSFRAHSPEYVVKEIEWLVSIYGAKDIRIVDDIFTLDKERVHKICDLIIEKKIDITWSCEARVDRVDEELLLKMKKAGCWEIGYGVETGSPEILKTLNKDVTIDRIIEVVYMTKKVGIQTRGFFIVGHKEDTPETIRQTIDFAKNLPFDIVQFSVAKFFPDTPIYVPIDIDWAQEVRKNKDFNCYIPKGMTYEYLKQMQDLAHKEFYSRPSFIIKQIFKIKNMTDIRRYLNGAKILLQVRKNA
jgi:radical SAM superfamily enzyme YgiQ (UPF0313 family)